MDFSGQDWSKFLGGIWIFVQFGAAWLAWHLLRRQPQWVRVIGTVATFLFPMLALIAYLIRGRLRDAVANVQAGLAEAGVRLEQSKQPPRLQREAASATSAAPRAASSVQTPTPTPTPAPAQRGQESLDPARLLSPDIHVRFDTAANAGRKLNIPKVVE